MEDEAVPEADYSEVGDMVSNNALTGAKGLEMVSQDRLCAQSWHSSVLCAFSVFSCSHSECCTLLSPGGETGPSDD